MWISITIYVLCLALLIWGGKFAGFKSSKLHEDATTLDVTKSLRGFSAIGVILHHISQNQPWQQFASTPQIPIFINAGFYFVAIFLFCSGFGLIKSFKSKPDYLNGFIKKRVIKTLLIPFYVNVILFVIWMAAIYFAGSKDSVQIASGWHLAALLSGVCLLNEYAWYPIVAILLYLAFYFAFKKIKNNKARFCFIAFIILFMGCFFCVRGHFAWWAGPKNWWLYDASNAKWWMSQGQFWFFGEWWVNSAPAFFIGMLFAQYEEKIKEWFKKLYWLKLIAIIILWFGFHTLASFAQYKFQYWSEFSGTGPGILNKFICYGTQIPQVCFFVILIFAILLKYHAQNPVSRFFGKVSFETYMMNLIPIQLFGYVAFINTNHDNYNLHLVIYIIGVFALTILLGLFYKWCNKQVNKLIK